jgi:DNA-directed RNA polymerase subunit N (RpoN/RPB10)
MSDVFLCLGCAKGLTSQFDKYMGLVEGGMDRDKALDEVGVLKLCCRNSSLLREKHADKDKRVITDEEKRAGNQFWCVGCQKNIAHMFQNYVDRVKAGEDRIAVLKDMGVTDECCVDTMKLAEQAKAA